LPATALRQIEQIVPFELERVFLSILRI